MDDDDKGFFVIGMALLVAAVIVWRFSFDAGREAGVVDACGPCNHVAECGPFKCLAGVEDWQKAGGAR